MSKEVKIGLAVMSVLLCVFGAVLYVQLHKQKPAVAARSKVAKDPQTAKTPDKKRKARISAGKHPPAFEAPSRRSADDAFAAYDRNADRHSADDESVYSATDRQNAWSSNPYSQQTPTEEDSELAPDVADSPYGDRFGRYNLRQDEPSGVEAVSDDGGDTVIDDAGAAMVDDVEIPEDRFADENSGQNWTDRRDEDVGMAPLATADPKVRPVAAGRDVDDQFAPTQEFANPDANDATDYAATVADPPRRLATAGSAGTYVVEANDNFWLISQKVYGTGAYYKALQEQNRRRFGETVVLNVGDEISVPSLEELRETYPKLCPKQPRLPVSERGAAAASTRDRAARLYTVAEGDTLFDIARHELGKASRWLEIYELNRDQLGDDFNYLAPGTQLALPGDAPEPVASRPRRDTYLR